MATILHNKSIPPIITFMGKSVMYADSLWHAFLGGWIFMINCTQTDAACQQRLQHLGIIHPTKSPLHPHVTLRMTSIRVRNESLGTNAVN